MALAAAEDVVLALDEPVTASVPWWRGDPQKSQGTSQNLLQVTSGIETGIGRAPGIDTSLQKAIVHALIEGFRFSGYIFGCLAPFCTRSRSAEQAERRVAMGV